MAFKINMIPLFKDEIIGAQGTAGTVISDIIDLREVCEHGACALRYDKAATGSVAGTTGSSTYTYLVASVRNGEYATGGLFATRGSYEGSRISAFTAVVASFMKIRVVTGTSNPLKLTAELNVR